MACRSRLGKNEALGIRARNATANRLIVDSVDQGIRQQYRERREDIPMLATRFLTKYAAEFGKPPMNISPEAMQKLKLYDWPGNVRELEHIVERAVALSEQTQIQGSDCDLIVKDFHISRLNNIYDGIEHVGQIFQIVFHSTIHLVGFWIALLINDLTDGNFRIIKTRRMRWRSTSLYYAGHQTSLKTEWSVPIQEDGT